MDIPQIVELAQAMYEKVDVLVFLLQSLLSTEVATECCAMTLLVKELAVHGERVTLDPIIEACGMGILIVRYKT